MKKSDKILKRQKYKIHFKNDDMDFNFNWLLGIGELFGMSHGELFFLASQMTKESPTEWRRVFSNHADFLFKSAHDAEKDQLINLAAERYLGATYAYKAVLQFSNPATPEFSKTVSAMEQAFLLGTKQLGAPVTSIDIPYKDTTLPGYHLKIDDSPRPTLIMVGGGDTSREDLFYFAGYPGWKRGYNVLMVDLPGQGKNPSRGLTFTVQANESISAIVDWLKAHDEQVTKIALYGVSGGGYFTAQAVEHDVRIDAWVASTPIYDVAELFRKEFGAALKAPGWLINNILKLSGNFNEVANISLKKYAWQFGTTDFASAIGEVFKQATVVDSTKLNCPALFMMGESEGPELQRQTRILFDSFNERGIPVTLRVFTAEDGADAHCQVNNLKLAHT
ncbi:MAG TPA: CocE/NonD family hydrolase, partial [Methylococcales bacterium]